MCVCVCVVGSLAWPSRGQGGYFSFSPFRERRGQKKKKHAAAAAAAGVRFTGSSRGMRFGELRKQCAAALVSAFVSPERNFLSILCPIC